MIILHFHLQPQFKYELFHIYFISIFLKCSELNIKGCMIWSPAKEKPEVWAWVKSLKITNDSSKFRTTTRYKTFEQLMSWQYGLFRNPVLGFFKLHLKNYRCWKVNQKTYLTHFWQHLEEKKYWEINI